MKLVILAGGSGTRLWPVSRKDTPKQIKPIIANQTLLVKTYERLRQGFPMRDIFIATNASQADIIKNQLSGIPDKNYIIEPAKRDTAAAIGLAAVYLSKQNPREIMININSDHYIKNEREYIRIIKLAEKVVSRQPGSGVLIGVNPTYPETGYGYIKMGEQAMEIGKTKIFDIDCFEEKPDMKTALKYLEQWEYLWNLGCFVWRVDTLLKLYKKFLPATYKILMKIKAAIGAPDEDKVIKPEFKKIKPISMDYGIIEKASGLLVIPADFGWADVGNWGTVKDILCKRKKGNIKKGKVLNINSEDNLIYNYTDKLVALIGVKEMVFIETEDAVLLCPKNRAQDVKDIVKELRIRGMEKYL